MGKKRTTKLPWFIFRYLKAMVFSRALLVRFIPTNQCNLKCQYCWQWKEKGRKMTENEFLKYFKKSLKLGVGMIDFMGGEPLIWKHIYKAISKCSEHHIITNLNTNGLLINNAVIDKLGKAGLDHLNVSVDGIKSSEVTKKCLENNKSLLPCLQRAKIKWGMKVRINSVIYKNNFNELIELIEILHKNNINLTLGFVVPHPFNLKIATSNKILFSEKDKKVLETVIDHIINKKQEGYKIIEPKSYFLNIFKFLKKEKFWNCNYPTRFGWVNIAPSGVIRSCTKKMDELDFRILELNSKKLKKLRKTLKKGVSQCNKHCYSNCAYDSWYFKNHKLGFFKQLIG